MPLDHPVIDLLVKLLLLFYQTCLEVTDVTNACVVQPLLQYTTHDRLLDSDRAVGRPYLFCAFL